MLYTSVLVLGPLFNNLTTKYTSIKFANLSMNALRIYGASSDSLMHMLQDLRPSKYRYENIKHCHQMFMMHLLHAQ